MPGKKCKLSNPKQPSLAANRLQYAKEQRIAEGLFGDVKSLV